MAPELFNLQNKISISHITIYRSGVILAFYLVVLEIIYLIISLLIRFPLSFFVTSVDSATTLYSVNTVIGFFLILTRVVLTIVIVYQWLNSRYQIRPGRVVYKKGILTRRDEEFNLTDIDKINCTQSFFGKIFNYGTINLFSSSINDWFYLYNIPNPDRYLKILKKTLSDKQVEITLTDETVKGDK